MTKNFARPLLDHESIEAFLCGCLNIRHELRLHGGDKLDLLELCKCIRDAERASEAALESSTMTSRRNRVPQYRSDLARDGLRRQIVRELISNDRLGSDDDIRLGHGGSKPHGQEAHPGACAYIVTGLPASGKSALVSAISDRLGAMVLDSDFAKRKLPEFAHALAGPMLVHEESRLLVFANSNPPSLSKYCMSKRLNVVVPLVGNDERRLKAVRQSFRAHGYRVHLTALLLSRAKATERALVRFLETGRYIPLSMIFDKYANDPVLNYYKAWMDADTGKDAGWASLGALVAANSPLRVHSFSSHANPAALWEHAA
ncbi:hypothetical protein F2P45_11875 [Massilia sp. CCM 8733]|uniref:Zeta toxin domain-containing protein n=1 Tax=Massilia mucilaginosa TaxID=2609282 RepID=A0ABX0NSG0_9BURK|nr:zeta toxin family protein [Massilia mucilaginosa]NHZ89704.1 hypothetical protein [Massilia mucilaginosa]